MVRARTEEYPFVGRESEQRLLEECIEDARHGRGKLIEIVGQTGVGKSRLAEQCRTMAGDMMQLNAFCEAYDSSTAYHVVQGLLRRLLELPVEGNDEELSNGFWTFWPNTLRLSLRGLLSSRQPSTCRCLTRRRRGTGRGFRRPRLAEVVIELLGNLLPQSGLLTIQDVHSMDEASADLFGYWLMRASRKRRGCGASHSA